MRTHRVGEFAKPILDVVHDSLGDDGFQRCGGVAL